MTTAGPPVTIGGIVIGAPVRLGGTGVDGPIVVPGSGDGGVQPYEHEQTQPATVWIVDHGLGRRPAAWSLYDDQDRLRDEYLVEHPTLNRAVVRMDVPTAGTITLI